MDSENNINSCRKQKTITDEHRSGSPSPTALGGGGGGAAPHQRWGAAEPNFPGGHPKQQKHKHNTKTKLQNKTPTQHSSNTTTETTQPQLFSPAHQNHRSGSPSPTALGGWWWWCCPSSAVGGRGAQVPGGKHTKQQKHKHKTKTKLQNNTPTQHSSNTITEATQAQCLVSGEPFLAQFHSVTASICRATFPRP